MFYWNNNESAAHETGRMQLTLYSEKKSVSSEYPSQDVRKSKLNLKIVE